ncbi:dipicolinate synthase subunit B [Garciella nitratireducens]|uniref:Dipicolinate synthase subunit B n=1 Tax=Garciella nitratireducens DSM 15102 TaxID=1121911 RepID=A0A1T4MZB1_9FIRM|nr:dipicolinate synthase subunit B [Garciella nitratireducens]RBP42729.1 dipicolinate synthase subunit B [Garciella nitratireducens]SJZ72440.1 dipicolinate synthase subunit B [Garciella nitratireducens DSM 15102]
MGLKGKKIGLAITGSCCNFHNVFPEIERLAKEEVDLYPIISEAVDTFDTRFGTAKEWKERLKQITKKELINSIIGAEPVGPKLNLDLLLVLPCTGNTLAKLANGITDSSTTMACKAHLRNQKPLVLAIATNDGLGANAKNIGLLLNTKNIYFVPFGQDDAKRKPNSLVAKFEMVLPTLEKALQGKQIQPVIL